MKPLLIVLFLMCITVAASAQLFPKKVHPSGLYFQWGYNKDWYSISSIRFVDRGSHDFLIYDVKARDRPDYSAIYKNPLHITIPQNSVRLGLYIDEQHTRAIELNFDHAKYVVDDDQVARVAGEINGERFDKDTLIGDLLHFEHSDGANFLQVNYVAQDPIWQNSKRTIASLVYKAGVGVVIPRSDVTILGKRLNNRYHIAGYIMSLEAGARYYPVQNLFVELTLKGGYADYLNALTVEGGTAIHHIYYGELIGLVGYDFNFRRSRPKRASAD
jgi:hypothetical protein